METVPDFEELSLPRTLEEIPAHAESKNITAGHSVKTLLSWSAPGRPFRKKSRQFYMTVLLIAMLIEVILFLFSQ